MRSKDIVRYKAASTAPEWMRKNAKRGLQWAKDGKAGDGVTDKTIREARAMASGVVSVGKAMRMAAWFARHMGDLSSPKAKVGADGYPSRGIVAHALWGGGSATDSQRAMSWASSVAKKRYKQFGGAGDHPNNKVLLISLKHLGNLHNPKSHGNWSKGPGMWVGSSVKKRLEAALRSFIAGGFGGGGGKGKVRGGAIEPDSTPRASPLNNGSWSRAALKKNNREAGDFAVTNVGLTTDNSRRRALTRGIGEFGRRKGKPNLAEHEARIQADFNSYVKAMKNIPTVKVLTKDFGEGGTRLWGKEHSFVIEYKGDGEARRLGAEFARAAKARIGGNLRGKQQDAYLVSTTVPSGFKSTRWYQSDATPRMTVRTRDLKLEQKLEIEKQMGDAGLGGWTWSKSRSGQVVLRLDWVERYSEGNTTKQWMRMADKVPAIVASVQGIKPSRVQQTRESVSTETWTSGNKDYAKLLRATREPVYTSGGEPYPTLGNYTPPFG